MMLKKHKKDYLNKHIWKVMIAIQIGLGTDNYLYPLHELIAWDNRNMRKEIYYCTQDDSIDCPIHQGEWIGWVEGAVVGEDEKAR